MKASKSFSHQRPEGSRAEKQQLVDVQDIASPRRNGSSRSPDLRPCCGGLNKRVIERMGAQSDVCRHLDKRPFISRAQDRIKTPGQLGTEGGGGGGRSGSLGLEPISGVNVPKGDEKWWLEAVSDLQTCSGKGNKYPRSVRSARWGLEEGKASSNFSFLC